MKYFISTIFIFLTIQLLFKKSKKEVDNLNEV